MKLLATELFFLFEIKTVKKIIISKGIQSIFINLQPKILNNKPAESAPIACVVNTIKSFIPCARNFSSDLYEVINKLVPEMNKKFQPKPNNIKPIT